MSFSIWLMDKTPGVRRQNALGSLLPWAVAHIFLSIQGSWFRIKFLFIIIRDKYPNDKCNLVVYYFSMNSKI